uniref:Uncharacterized protein n=1 Tax=Rhipicephalus zambeziensis TaxID=60191 RepID=A0A224YRF3_9ACAR
MKGAVVEGSGNFDHLGFFSMYLNLSTQTPSIFASIDYKVVSRLLLLVVLRVRFILQSRCVPRKPGCPHTHRYCLHQVLLLEEVISTRKEPGTGSLQYEAHLALGTLGGWLAMPSHGVLTA